MRQFFLAIMSLSVMPAMISAQAIRVFNANSVADIIEKKSATYKSFKANFVYQKDKRSFSGVMTYVAPNKFVMSFSKQNASNDKKIVSDGTFILIQEGDIIARQKLGKETNPIVGWNIRRLRKQYIPTAPSTGVDIKYGTIPAYQLNFEPKWNTTSFRSIELIADKDGLIRRIKGISRVGAVTTLSLSYLEFNKSYDPKIFVIETSEDSQIFDNIFD